MLGLFTDRVLLLGERHHAAGTAVDGVYQFPAELLQSADDRLARRRHPDAIGRDPDRFRVDRPAVVPRPATVPGGVVEVRRLVRHDQLLRAVGVDAVAGRRRRQIRAGEKPRRLVQRLPAEPVQHVLSGIQRHVQPLARRFPSRRIAARSVFRPVHGSVRHVHGHHVPRDNVPIETHIRRVQKPGTRECPP